MIERKVEVGGKAYTMRSSALIPRLYRAQFGRDMVADMRKLITAYRATQGMDGQEAEEKRLSVMDLEIFENVAWVMLRHGGEAVGDSPEEWLDSLDGVFDIYEVLPVILELWNENNKTTSKPKKK